MLLSPLVHSLEKATQSRYHFSALLNIVKWESSSLFGCVNIFTNANSKEFGLCVCMHTELHFSSTCNSDSIQKTFSKMHIWGYFSPFISRRHFSPSLSSFASPDSRNEKPLVKCYINLPYIRNQSSAGLSLWWTSHQKWLYVNVIYYCK